MEPQPNADRDARGSAVTHTTGVPAMPRRRFRLRRSYGNRPQPLPRPVAVSLEVVHPRHMVVSCPGSVAAKLLLSPASKCLAVVEFSPRRTKSGWMARDENPAAPLCGTAWISARAASDRQYRSRAPYRIVVRCNAFACRISGVDLCDP